MDPRVPAVADQLLLIEAALRQAGLWSGTAPDPEALQSTQPFCVDTLRFEQWLQWVLLPRMKVLLEGDLPLPAASGIQAMAEQVYVGEIGRLGRLIEALAAFDRLIGGEA